MQPVWLMHARRIASGPIRGIGHTTGLGLKDRLPERPEPGRWEPTCRHNSLFRREGRQQCKMCEKSGMWRHLKLFVLAFMLATFAFWTTMLKAPVKNAVWPAPKCVSRPGQPMA